MGVLRIISIGFSSCFEGESKRPVAFIDGRCVGFTIGITNVIPFKNNKTCMVHVFSRTVSVVVSVFLSIHILQRWVV